MGRRKTQRPDDATLLRQSEEVGRIQRAAPDGREVARALGPFRTTNVPTMVESPTGEFEVNVTHESADPHENRMRMGLVNDAMEEKRKLETERTHRLAATEDRIVIHDARTGDVREIPAHMEDQIARKKWARPGSRSRKYFFMGH